MRSARFQHQYSSSRLPLACRSSVRSLSRPSHSRSEEGDRHSMSLLLGSNRPCCALLVPKCLCAQAQPRLGNKPQRLAARCGCPPQTSSQLRKDRLPALSASTVPPGFLWRAACGPVPPVRREKGLGLKTYTAKARTTSLRFRPSHCVSHSIL